MRRSLSLFIYCLFSIVFVSVALFVLQQRMLNITVLPVGPVELRGTAFDLGQSLIDSKDKYDFVRSCIDCKKLSKSGSCERSLAYTFSQLHDKVDSFSCLDTFAKLNELEVLNLQNRAISNLRPLANFKNLVVLNLSKNAIKDVSPLANLSQLTMLGLGHNQIESIEPLASLVSLTSITLYNNSISSLEALKSHKNLKFCSFRANKVSDLSPLNDISSLKRVNLGENLISDFSAVKHVKQVSGKYFQSLRNLQSRTH